MGYDSTTVFPSIFFNWSMEYLLACVGLPHDLSQSVLNVAQCMRYVVPFRFEFSLIFLICGHNAFVPWSSTGVGVKHFHAKEVTS